jgi:octaprenyl-diphosphate synthase
MNPPTDCLDVAAEDLAQVVAVFDDEIQSDLPFLNELTQRTRAYRGKLLRPKLLLLSGRATGALCRDHIVLAAVVEMVHMATLVHDDVLDEADLRRCGPTVNHTAGNEAAVLLGDYLISHAYHLCSSLGSVAAARRIAAATNTICEGELLQISHRGNWNLTEEEYLEIIRRKTAVLTSLCCELGAEKSSAPSLLVRRLAEFGMDVGMAFQIVDDLLDLTGSQEDVGKTTGRDAEMGKLTLPTIRFLRHAAAAQRRRLIDALSNGQPHRNDAVRTILAQSDVLDDAWDTARAYVASAVKRLDALAPSEAKDALVAAAEYVVARRR